MSSTTVSCPCGVSFERPIQRGRPAIWCHECRKLPVAQRSPRPEGEADVTESKVSRFGEHDTLTYDEREAVEAGVAEVYRKWHEEIVPNKAEFFAGEEDIERAGGDWQQDALTAVYAGVKKEWWRK